MDHGQCTLRSLRVVTPGGVRAADIAIRGDRIAAVLGYDDPETDGVILDAGDCAVQPGLADIRADFTSSGPKNPRRSRAARTGRRGIGPARPRVDEPALGRKIRACPGICSIPGWANAV